MEEKINSTWEGWEIEQDPLGEGTFGKVYKAVNKTHDVEMFSAIKIITIRKTSLQSESYFGEIVKSYENEIKTMIKLGNTPNIVNIHDYKVIKKDSVWEIHIRMEYLTSFTDYTAGKNFNQKDIVKIGTDICSALELCAEQPKTIIHRDIKPDNIFVTKSGDFKLGDFGEARELEKSKLADSKRGTPKYMAPEVYKENKYNETADIYSLGIVLYELMNDNRIPFCPSKKQKQIMSPEDEINALKKRNNGEIIPPPKNANEKMAKVILRACESDPKKRFQSASEFKQALKSIEEPDPKSNTFFKMFISALIVSLLFIIIRVGLNTFNINVAALEIEPQFITLSLQQTSGLTVNKIMANGDITLMNPNDLIWSSENDNIARVDGNRIVGTNLGKTTIEGKYQNQIINLVVNVIEPMDGMVDILQHYELGHKVTLFGGTLERERIDGLLDGIAKFISPESIDIIDDGTIYITDSGILRRIKNDTVESIKIEPFYMIPNIVRCYKNEVYILTSEWEELDGSQNYGIVRLKNDNTVEEIYITNAKYTTIEDFGFSTNDDNLLYFIERNAGINEVSIKSINLQTPKDISFLFTLPKGTKSLAFDEDNTIYFANPETGVIYYYKNGELKYFAGTENEKAFKDGNTPVFYMPQKIKYADNSLYVWDFNVLRKIKIENGIAVDCMTLAGEASPIFDLENIENEYNAENMILPNSRLCDFEIMDGGVLLTDPKRGLIWKVEYK